MCLPPVETLRLGCGILPDARHYIQSLPEATHLSCRRQHQLSSFLPCPRFSLLFVSLPTGLGATAGQSFTLSKLIPWIDRPQNFPH